jgi:phenylalanine-4-hydroxylase
VEVGVSEAAPPLLVQARAQQPHPCRIRRPVIYRCHPLSLTAGMSIPRVDYTKEEIATWGAVYAKLGNYTRQFAVEQYNTILPLLEKVRAGKGEPTGGRRGGVVFDAGSPADRTPDRARLSSTTNPTPPHCPLQNCGYSTTNIPQLQDISDFLKSATGFTIRPVGGLLSARDFLNALAFRVFFSTQYIRHHSRPLYTPEPDVCHELMGHAPMFADPDFAGALWLGGSRGGGGLCAAGPKAGQRIRGAVVSWPRSRHSHCSPSHTLPSHRRAHTADFSHEIGLASLGASDDDIKKLATCYWFSVEFGLAWQGGARKAYGAGLLSSFGELEYACAPYRPAGGTDASPEYRPWEPRAAAVQSYPITTYQPVYYVADSLGDAKARMREYCDTAIHRGFNVKYDPATSSVRVDRAVVRGEYTVTLQTGSYSE